MQVSTPSKEDSPSLHLTSPDPEKGHQITTEPSAPSDTPSPSDHSPHNTFQKWNQKIEALAGFEARGITRVLPEERHGSSLSKDLQIGLLWFSANMTANLLAVGFLGPLVFTLGFVDSVLCAVFGSFLGSVVAAYMSTWGAQSGNRTMVVARFFMGYWPSKICALLNIVVLVGYGMIDCIIGGQLLSAVSGGSMSIIVGIIIIAGISWIIAMFGMYIFHAYERWAWAPQLVVLLVLVGNAASNFDTSTPSVGSSSAISANRLSYFSLCLSVTASWGSSSSDYFVYYPETTPKWKPFLFTLTGMSLAVAFNMIIGVGLSSGVANTPAWSEANSISSGALILAGYSGLPVAFAKFCGVIVALGLIANNIPGTYSAALGFQMLGRYPNMIPRYIWTCVVVGIYFICAMVGRNSLFLIFQNFLALMGYWVTVFVSIVVEEHVLFKWNQGFDWSAWKDQKRLPIGYAALTAFLVGWAGCIVSMYQVYYTGPVAALVGDYGADLGIWVGCGFALLTYPPLRFLELKFVGR